MLTISPLTPDDLSALQAEFGKRLQIGESLARHTSARLGGTADVLLTASSMGELAHAAAWLWRSGLPFIILGSGSNVLVSDAGVRGIVILNAARALRFIDSPEQEPPLVWAESGVNIGLLARQAAQRGLAGMEWAAGIPGTLGGAVVGNAGAHGKDMADSLQMAEILHHQGYGNTELWKGDRFEFDYRSSVFKHSQNATQEQPWAVVLAVTLKLVRDEISAIQERMDALVAVRRRTQPPGASMGSMFKNPPGDFAGRLIEAAGLKGTRLGEAGISPLHANFFINYGQANAHDVYRLICMAREKVQAEFGITLELEVELIGEWQL
jgi:UDP-N-acetylmuramate dehydrogenase